MKELYWFLFFLLFLFAVAACSVLANGGWSKGSYSAACPHCEGAGEIQQGGQNVPCHVCRGKGKVSFRP